MAPGLGADTSYIALAVAGFAGFFLLVAAMGLFSWKNQMPVEGKTILITGASEGLGRSAVRQLAAKGANIILVARNSMRLREAVAEAQSAAKNPSVQRFHHISADVSVPNCGAKIIADATAWNNGAPPDIVWCVAGLSTPRLFAEEGTMAELRYNTSVNFFGAAEVTHAIISAWVNPTSSSKRSAAEQNKKPEPKHLVLTASVLALFGVLGYSPYTPSKWAVRGLADTLAQEVRLYPDTPIRVHVVYPGTILSPGFEREQRTKPDITKQLEKDDPQQTPDEVAAAAIRGLEKGHYGVTVSWLSALMLWGMMGASQRNNWLVDSIMAMVTIPIYAIVQLLQNSEIASYVKKHGHPTSWPKKSAEVA